MTTGWITAVWVSLLPIHQDLCEQFFVRLPVCGWIDECSRWSLFWHDQDPTPEKDCCSPTKTPQTVDTNPCWKMWRIVIINLSITSLKMMHFTWKLQKHTKQKWWALENSAVIICKIWRNQIKIFAHRAYKHTKHREAYCSHRNTSKVNMEMLRLTYILSAKKDII